MVNGVKSCRQVKHHQHSYFTFVQICHDVFVNFPAGFDVEGFLTQARKSFITLQAANDRGDLKAIRNLVTEEMFEALERDVLARHAAGGWTDVVTLDARLLEVVTEKGMHRASIRFSGMLREERDGPPTPFEEVWNLQKPEKGRSGWLLAGIQPVS